MTTKSDSFDGKRSRLFNAILSNNFTEYSIEEAIEELIYNEYIMETNPHYSGNIQYRVLKPFIYSGNNYPRGYIINIKTFYSDY